MPTPRRSTRNTAKPQSSKTDPMEIDDSEKEETNDTTTDKSDDDSSSDESSSSEDFEFESLAKTRSKRVSAGMKMKQLIEEQKEKDAKEMAQAEDAYKDFFDVENDQDFEADDAVLKSDSEVDSDFDQDEGPEEDEDAGEKDLRSEGRAQNSQKAEKAKKKREKMMKELATSLLVPDNIVDDRTHARFLQEAKIVAKKNTEDLRRIELELERQRNQALEAFRPKERVQRHDVIKTESYFDENGKRATRVTVPNDMIRDWKPSKIWLERQHLMPPKPPGFDDLPYEKI